ncbi:MAG: hypothetical protein QME96_18170 [Myxococcota bacterium]|nr:hypothetical protein [Myxococcota bacterium]
MRKAVGITIAVLDSAAEIDIDRSDDDRKFFEEEKQKLDLVATSLAEAARVIDAFVFGPALRFQARVQLGDAVLDRGVRNGNARTKLALRNVPGLDAAHAFGRRIDDLTSEKLRMEPLKVEQAAARLADLPAFDGRDAIKSDLLTRAGTQERLLKERDGGYTERERIESAAVRVVAEAADALAKIKAKLDDRFPRQRNYVAGFFLDVSGPRTPERPDAGDSAAPEGFGP